MSENRRKPPPWRRGLVLLGMVWVILQTALPAGGDPPASSGNMVLRGKSPVVVLSGEFFQAMDKLANSGTVSGDRQELFLEQIATAQRYMVKTNLTLIEQHEKIIRLLEELKFQGPREAR